MPMSRAVMLPNRLDNGQKARHLCSSNHNQFMDRRIDETAADCIARESHVVLLVNFVAPNMLPVFQCIAGRVGRLTVLSSVAVESNRSWNPDWGDLDVVVQKTITITRHPRHPGGYRDVNYIHVPVDTIGRLRRLGPDAIVSLELGARTALACTYRRFSRRCALIAAVNASERSEAGRGRVRKFLRRRILPRVDGVTFNGPSCRRLLLSLGADPDTLWPWYYAADPTKAYAGPLAEKRLDQSKISLLTIGELSDRKGLMPAIEQLSRWARSQPHRIVEWHLVGSGPLESALAQFDSPQNLHVHLHGFCGPEAIREHYRNCDLSLFPTLCDEWGLVVDESLLSGLPVIGSGHAQAVTTLIRDGENGMIYDPQQDSSLSDAMNRYVGLPEETIGSMPLVARESAAERTCENSAKQFAEAVSLAIARRRAIAAR